MGFLSPWSALIAGLLTVPPLVALYFLKLRRRQVSFPSTLLWRKAIHDMQVNAPFQKLRRNLLLLLQLLILAALLVAMARPTMQRATRPGQRLAIVVDHSGSMRAEDGSPTRLAAAKASALELIDDLGAGESSAAAAMVVSFAERARVVQQFTSDLTKLRAAVRSIEPTDQRSRLQPALQLIEPFALQAAESDDSGPLAVYVLSDGRVHKPEQADLALRGAELKYVRMGSDKASDVNNVGFVSFSARRDFEQPARVQVFARLANAGAQAVEPNVELRLAGSVRRVQSVSVPAAGSDGPGTGAVQFQFTLPESTLVSVRHDHNDMLGADDTARLVLAPARRLRVLLVTTGNGFLERVIRSVGVRQLVAMHPDKYENQDPERLQRGGWQAPGSTASAAQGFDVIIFDDYAPSRVPVVSSLYFGAAPPIEQLKLRPARSDDPDAQALLDWQRDHPLLRYVVLDNLILNQPGRLAVPTDARVLATAQAGPVLASMRRGGAHHIVASFDVLQTNWPMQVSFPVFVSNVVQTLGLGALADEAGVSYRAGQVASVPGASDQTLTYEGPTTLSARVSGGEAVLPRFTRAGIYEAQSDSIDAPYDRLPVNMLDELESDVRPAEQLKVGTVSVSGQSGSRAVRQEIWPWFAWAALGVLLLEWFVYTRRMHL